jgi:hypothetical protein
MKAKATAACLGCHEARIILQQRLTKAAWTKEVDKMMKWGAIVDSNDHDALVDYLSTNFSPDKDPVRSATDLDRKGFPEIANSEIPPNWFFEKLTHLRNAPSVGRGRLSLPGLELVHSGSRPKL